MARQEDAIVERIRRIFDQAEAIVGIGDDAAVVASPGELVITSDLLIEEIDFTFDAPAGLVGRKALAVNLSDLAAMGARPLWFTLDLGIPARWQERLDDLLHGMAQLARRYGIALIGGDLSAAAQLTISITAIGTPAGARPLLRSGARPGNRLYVSRPLGGSAAGLTLLSRGWLADESSEIIGSPQGATFGYAQRELAAGLLRQQLAPEPESALGQALATLDVTSCIDISDGLSTDLHRICSASAVGATIEWEKIPIFPDLLTVGRSLGVNVEEVVLHGGEELALLFTSPLLEYDLSQRLGRPVYLIGRITAAEGISLQRGDASVPLGDYGFDHFRE
jgi:thiamine-monophosphate kinase